MNDDGTIYFWNGARIHTYVHDSEEDFHDAVGKRGFRGMWCLDTRFERGCYEDKTSDRYGRMRTFGWQAKSFNAFPKKFKAHLLIMGVT